MIDTHTHIYLENDFPDKETENAVSRAIANGVSKLIFPGVDLNSLPMMMKLHAQFPDNTWMAIGLHPTEIKEGWENELTKILTHISDPGVVAIGEVGLDYHEDKSYVDMQRKAFSKQILTAHSHNLPLIIHQRDALDDLLELITIAKTENHLPSRIVFHCFTGTADDASKIKELLPDAYFGIGGVATFKNAAAVREALPVIGIDNIVLETDAPWLAPVPYRGKRNESAYIPIIAKTIADTLGLSIDTVEQKTDTNALRLFPLIS